MSNFIVLFVCLIAGLAARRARESSEPIARAFNQFVLNISLPALVLVQVPKLLSEARLEADLLLPVLMPWAIFLLSWLLFGTIGRGRGWSAAKTGAMVLTAGLGNTSFVGFPLVEALLGASRLKYAVIVDQLGSFLTVSTLGLVVAAFYGGRSTDWRRITRRIVLFPPFLALVAAMLWWKCGQFGSDLLTPAFERIGGTLVPLALFAVGLQLRLDPQTLRGRVGALSGGLAYKLVFSPVLFAGVAMLFAPDSEAAKVTILEAGMAPMITAGVVAGEAGLDRDLCALMIGVGIPLSLASVPIYAWFLA